MTIIRLFFPSLFKTDCIVSFSFYAKVSNLHAELYNSPATALTNPLVAFTLIKRLQSEWLNVVYSNEALENAQGLALASLRIHLLVITARLLSSSNPTPLTHPSPVHLLTLHCSALRSGYEEEEADLPNLEDLQGAANGLMRLQDVYSLQVPGLVRGQFQRVTNGRRVDIYLPAVSVQLSGDDCFLVGKVYANTFFITSKLTRNYSNVIKTSPKKQLKG